VNTTFYGVPILPAADPLVAVLADIEASGPFGVDVLVSDHLPPGFAVKSGPSWHVTRADFDRLQHAAAPAAEPA